MSAKESTRILVDNLVYTKSAEWAHEREYRLYVPLFIKAHEKFGFLEFYSEELSAIYLGVRMPEEQKKAVAFLAKRVNPDVSLFEVKTVAREYGLTFHEYLQKK